MGTHLPQVFLGMQNHAMNNMTAAEEFLKTAYGLCSTDPLLLNEMGVVFYHQDRLKEAAQVFRQALKIADEIDSDPAAWLSARTNLAHTYRRLRMHKQALDEFDRVLRDGGKDSNVFAAKGLIYLDQNKPELAVQVLHEALAIHPQDQIATELLNKALEETVGGDAVGGGGEEEEGELEVFERELAQRKAEAGAKMSERLRGAGRKGKGKGADVGGSPRGKGKGRAMGGGRERREQSLMDITDDEEVR
jgi:anaphase-promoting complex subunit 6